MENVKDTLGTFSLDAYKRASNTMVAANDRAYSNSRWYGNGHFETPPRQYTEEEIDRILTSGDYNAKVKLSRDVCARDGIYKSLLIYYATLLKYVGILIPNPSFGVNLSTDHVRKRYNAAVAYVDKMNLPVFLTDCAFKALRDGSYYGIRTSLEGNKKGFCAFDLPPAYCRTRFKDLEGNSIVEFNISYFLSITDEAERKSALSVYPEFIQSAWRRYRKGKLSDPWVIVPSENGICFPFFDGTPYFLGVVKQALRYDDAIELDKERNLEEIRKILVQKIPHLTDGRLLFEPDEAAEMHSGAVQMLKGNKNLSVLTTYTDVDSIVSKTTADTTADNTIQKMYQNIYSQAGTSAEVFASTGSSTLQSAIKKDIALMMALANKFARWVTSVINDLHGNSNITFRYMILPVSYQNESDYIADAFKLAGSGYSFLLPAVAQGFSQKELGNIKDLENQILKLDTKLKPLSSAYTQSGSEGKGATDEGGAPPKDDSEKADKTLQNEKSLDNQAGGFK